MYDPPPPPARLLDVPVVVGVGTAIWFLVWAGLLIAHFAGGRALDIWFSTTLVGWLLGGLGLAVFAWQRHASRRGSRTAQRGL